MPRDIVLLGGPGAGKGTQAQILQKQFGYRQISTGDLLRAHVTKGTELGKAADGFMKAGALVPDDLIIKMVEGELQGDTALLFDGFPRTVAQAQALDALLESRGPGLPGAVYHEKFSPPKVAGVCDDDGGPLIQRPDDNAETIKKRLDVFERETMPLVAYYRADGRLTSIDATQPIEHVTHMLMHAIGVEHDHV